MSAKTLLPQQARCRTKQRAGAWWPTSASSDAGVVELSTRGLLLFSPRTYWRLFQLANESLWPLQIPVLLIGAAILAMLFRPRGWADRVIPAVLAAAWLCVSVGFFWMHYAAI